MKILINTDITSEQQQQIASVSDDLSLVLPQNSEEALREIVDTDIVLGGFNRSLFENAEQLKWVQVLSAGVDGLLFPAFVESDVILTSAKGFVGPHLADQAWALLLGSAPRCRTFGARADVGESDVDPPGDLGIERTDVRDCRARWHGD